MSSWPLADGSALAVSFGVVPIPIRYSTFPRTRTPPSFADDIVDVFRAHEPRISTSQLKKGLTSDAVLSQLREHLVEIGFAVEKSKAKEDKIHTPVFFGEDGKPALHYELDAYHQLWKCGLEVEAGRATMGNAIYRDLVQAMVMVEVDALALAVPNAYRYAGDAVSADYENAVRIADTLYSHRRVEMPYQLIVIGY